MLRNRQTKEKILKYCIQPTRLDESVRMLATDIVWMLCSLYSGGGRGKRGRRRKRGRRKGTVDFGQIRKS